MAGFSFQHYILDPAVLVAVYAAVCLYYVYCQFPLHDSGLLCLCAHIIKTVPLHQILSNGFPVKKYDRHIIIPGKVNDLRWVRPIHQVYTEDITARVNQFLHLVILGPL